MKKYIVSFLIISILLIGTPFAINKTSAQELSLRDFINLLIAINVITPDKLPVVNTFLANLENNQDTTVLKPANQDSINQRNSKRRSDVMTILNAIYQYAIDNNKTQANSGVLPLLGLKIGNTCDSTSTSASSLAPYLVTTFLSSIPTDSTGDNYYVIQNTNGRITVCAPKAEGGVSISVTR
jgi:hypothetical protein